MADIRNVGMIATGGLMLLLAPALYYTSWIQRNEWARCVGRVVHVSRSEEQGRVATVKYTNHKGEECSWRMCLSDTAPISLGSEVKLLYNPQAPTDLAHDDKGSSMTQLIGMFSLGLFLVLTGIYWASSEAAMEETELIERDSLSFHRGQAENC